jgi:hypothetical protein
MGPAPVIALVEDWCMSEQTAVSTNSDESLIHLPAVDIAERLACVRHLAAMLDELLPEGERSHPPYGGDEPLMIPSHLQALHLIVRLTESLLLAAPDDVSPRWAAEIAFMAAMPGVAENVALQIGFGESAGRDEVQKLMRLIGEAKERGLTADEYIMQLQADGGIPRDENTRRLHGETSAGPIDDRLRRGVAVLRRIAALVPDFYRPHLLSVIGWMLWARGRRSVALNYVAEALRIDPASILGYGLAVILSSRMPAWVSDG